MIFLMTVLLISKYEPIEGKGKYHLVEGRGKHYLAKVEESSSQNVTEDLKDASASYPKAREWRLGDPYKGKSTKKGARRRKGKETGWLDEIRKGKDYKGEGLRRQNGKDYQQAESWLNECSLKEEGERNKFCQELE